MRKHFIWIGFVAVILLSVSTSCRKKQQLTVTKDSLTYNSSGGMDIFQVVANCEWTIKPSADWFYVGQTTVSNDTTTVPVFAQKNTSSVGRSGMLTVTSSNGKIERHIQVNQTKIEYSSLTKKVWFTRTHERWNTDYYGDSIPDSYRFWRYYANPGTENWFWYFYADTLSYLIHTKDYDTVYYPFEYKCKPELDQFYVNFVTTDSTMEDYNASINQLDDNYFIFTNEYRPHHFEKNTLTDVTGGSKSTFTINPKKVKLKPAGPMIPVK